MSKDPRQNPSDPWKLDQMDLPPQRRDYQSQQHHPMYPGVQQHQQLHPQTYPHALSGPESASLTSGGYHHQQQLPPPQIPPQPNHHLPHLHTSIPSMNGMNSGMGMNGIPMMNMSASHTSIMQQPQQQPQAPPSLAPVSFTKDGKIYSLEVKQQPVRARMCGFGDKDRRPITPPPCIKLVIRDAATGQELEPSDDTTSFILLVDIWDESGTHEVSLVRHSNSSPAISISAATTAPYPPPVERPYLGLLDPAQLQSYYVSIGDHTTASNLTHLLTPRQQQQQAQAAYQQQQVMGFGGAPVQRGYPQPYPGQPQQHFMPPTIPVPAVMASTTTTGMFTKNLIGSLCANATRLNDPEGKPGYWFILQDLSIRTEGNFRLKLSFVDISPVSGSSDAVNKGKVPVLAMTYTETFQVYSAKKFPGVIESTELSKCFAQQGIKIPIRKDGHGTHDCNAASFESETPSRMPATPVYLSAMSARTASRANKLGSPSSRATMSKASAALLRTAAAIHRDHVEIDENRRASKGWVDPVSTILPTFKPKEKSIFGSRR